MKLAVNVFAQNAQTVIMNTAAATDTAIDALAELTTKLQASHFAAKKTVTLHVAMARRIIRVCQALPPTTPDHHEKVRSVAEFIEASGANGGNELVCLLPHAQAFAEVAADVLTAVAPADGRLKAVRKKLDAVES